MSTRNAPRLAWSAWAITVALVVIRIVLLYLNNPASFWGNFYKVLSLSFATVGALVASRRPMNPIGWIFVAGALLVALSDFSEQYAFYALVTHPGAIWGGQVVGWIRLWSSLLGFYLIFAFTFLLFPNGRLLSRRWRPVLWVTAGTAGFLTIMGAIQPGPLINIPSRRNPFGIEGMAGILPWMQAVLYILVLATIGAAAFSMILRFRRAQGEEQLQLKWIAYAAAVLIIYSIVGGSIQFLAPQYVLTVEAVEAPVLVALPVAVGVAILKYRLYDIELIIRRTLIYGILTAALALVYFSTVTLLQMLFRSMIGQQQSPIVIVLSTLAIAALFAPLRRRVQAVVDRRFFRKKYNAEQVLASFSARLREGVDLEQLTDLLVEVVQETMQPEHVSLWLRKSGAEKMVGFDTEKRSPRKLS